MIISLKSFQYSKSYVLTNIHYHHYTSFFENIQRYLKYCINNKGLPAYHRQAFHKLLCF